MSVPYFLRPMQSQPPQVWRMDEKAAVLLGVSNPEQGAGTYYAPSGPHETALDAMKRQTPWFSDGDPFIRLELPPGHYYPRIARPGALAEEPRLWNHNDDPNFTASAASQAAVLTADLARICRVIHPSPDTLATYGHDIRNLLVLAATEVEMHCRGILMANGAKKRGFTMADYTVLSPLLGLPEYSVRFPAYPWLGAIRPFAAWDHPGAALPWWSAYNGVKHDRDSEFHRATLEHAFEAVSACVVLLVAQFGGAAGFGVESSLSRFFKFERQPVWSLAQCYCGFLSESGGAWEAQPHPKLAAL